MGDNVLCSMAFATRTSLHTAMQTELNASINGESGLFIQLHHDATPLFVRFGRLQPYLMESSRYLVQDGTKWVSVNYNEYVSDVQKP